MGDFSYSVLLIALGWAIPFLMTWAWAKVPSRLVSEHPLSVSILISGVFAAAIAATALIIYDRFIVAKDIVVFAHENGSCPTGYRDMSTIRFGTWKGAPERFQTAQDINLRVGTSEDGNWPYDHIKLCLRK